MKNDFWADNYSVFSNPSSSLKTVHSGFLERKNMGS